MSSKEILKLNLKKNWRGYEAFLILIAALEGMMMIYGLWHFDLHDIRRKLYFSSYVFLFCCSILTMIINRSCMKRETHEGLAIRNLYLYSAVLILWSAVISVLDITGGGYAVTYMTILAAVGSVIPLPPLVYTCLAAISSCGIIMAVVSTGTVSLGIPFYLNHMIFLLVVILVEFRNYRSTRGQYILDMRMEALAGVDSLTRVANRRSLDKYIAQLIQEHSQFVFALLDVDNFKAINDAYGHLEGDLCLMSIANVLTEFFGEHVFRYGGNEFAVISFEDAELVAEKMALVNLRLKENSVEYVLQICAGVYQNAAQDDERRIFELADSALYEAKQTGKSRSVIYRAPLSGVCANPPSHSGT